jgi:hypothetical protein
MNDTRAEYDLVGVYPVLSLIPSAGFHVGRWAVVIFSLIKYYNLKRKIM